jgi:Peptidase S46
MSQIMRLRQIALVGAASIATIVVHHPAKADEGMWTFDGFPAAKMQKDHGWSPDQKWLDRVRGAAVRLTGGCSASFVSPDGLILTNHHCIVDCAQDLSTASDDLVANGFVAADRSRERKCPGQQAEVVTAIQDVTADLKAAIGNATGADLIKARDGRIAEIEKAGCSDLATTRCQVVSLFGGGQYKLYRYRKYSDVRLVWAPEMQAAFFGGDPDNFNYPRYALDASFLRAYENGKPVKVTSFLKWSPRAPVEGEATFVVGNPGSTQRLFTSDQIAFQREVALPITLALFSELRGRLIQAMSQSADREREGKDELFGIENSLKVYIGRQQALNDPAFTARLAAAEADLKARSSGNAAIGDPWGDVATAVKGYREVYLANRMLAPSSELQGYAQMLVRAAAERAKPNSERLPGFTDSALPLTEKQLTDAAPTYPWLEQLLMEWSFSKAREYLGADDRDTRLLLGKESPEALAERLVVGTKLDDPAVRKALWDGGQAAIEASTDPLIVHARQLDARQRELKKAVDQSYTGPLATASSKLTQARFAAYGDTLYPDATFTLRISYGKVKGWAERGQQVKPVTTIGGAFDRATGSYPFDLPKAYAVNEAKIDKSAAYNFVTTNDIIGGNSGSPVIDRNGAAIGAAFDGNIHSLGGNYGYDAELNRTVVVSAAAVQEAMRTIYPAPALLAELGGKASKRKK